MSRLAAQCLWLLEIILEVSERLWMLPGSPCNQRTSLFVNLRLQQGSSHEKFSLFHYVFRPAKYGTCKNQCDWIAGTGKASAVTQFFPNDTGAGTPGARFFGKETRFFGKEIRGVHSEGV